MQGGRLDKLIAPYLQLLRQELGGRWKLVWPPGYAILVFTFGAQNALGRLLEWKRNNQEKSRKAEEILPSGRISCFRKPKGGDGCKARILISGHILARKK